MATKRWSVKGDHGKPVSVEAFDNRNGNISEVIVYVDEGEAVYFDHNKFGRIDALIADLIAARTFAWGRPPVLTTATVDNSVDLRSLIASLKDLTQSRSEFARCEKALEVLGGQQ